MGIEFTLYDFSRGDRRTHTMVNAAGLFEAEFNEGLIFQLVQAYRASARSGSKAQKTRAEVSGGGAKPWKQKGSGRARAGSSRSPLWRTGGIAFAAKPREFTQKVNRKMYRLGMRSILSELHRQGRVLLCQGLNSPLGKTKDLVLEFSRVGVESGRVLVVLSFVNKQLSLASRNVPWIKMLPVSQVNPYDLVSSDSVIFELSALEALGGAWL